MCSIKVILLIFCLYCFNTANSDWSPSARNSSTLWLYLGHNFDGQIWYETVASPDLGANDNHAHSMIYNGIWVLYENKNYNSNAEGLVIWRNSVENAKEVLPNNGIGGKISSLRPVGLTYPNSWQTPSLSIFQGINFTGAVTKPLVASTPQLNFKNATSLIIVGKGVSWTFYDETYFSGNGRCLTTKDLVNYYPNLDAVGFDLRLAASVEKGCWAMHGVPMYASDEHNLEN